MKKNVSPNTDFLIEQLEYEISQIYGNDFVIELQGFNKFEYSVQSENIIKDLYLNLLRGVWFATHQNKLKV